MLSIFFIGLALSMDAFGLSIGIGMQKISKRTFILLPLCVAVFHFLMPMLGNSFSFFIRDILYFDPSFLMVAVFFYLSIMMFVTRNNEDNVILKSFISILFTVIIFLALILLIFGNHLKIFLQNLKHF